MIIVIGIGTAKNNTKNTLVVLQALIALLSCVPLKKALRQVMCNYKNAASFDHEQSPRRTRSSVSLG